MAKSLLDVVSLRLNLSNYTLKYLDCEAKGFRRAEVEPKRHRIPSPLMAKERRTAWVLVVPLPKHNF